MPQGFYDDLVEIMRRHGCEKIPGGKGSHEKWKSPINGRVTTVPGNCRSRHTANAVLKQLGIDEKL